MRNRRLYVAMTLGILVGPACYGQAGAVKFDVVSVKMHAPENHDGRMQLTPDGIRLSNLALPDFIREAFGLVLSDQVVGIASWANSERFDVEAKVASADVAAFRKLTLDQIRPMGQQILTERFRFAYHMETKVLPVYTLTVAKGGSKLKPSTMSDEDPNARTGVIGMRRPSNGNGLTSQLTATGVTMERLASTLSQQGLGRVVLDNTGLAGRYDFQLSWGVDPIAAGANSTETSGPSVFTAFSEQLGLRLEPGKAPVPVLVIDHIEMPSPN